MKYLCLLLFCLSCKGDSSFVASLSKDSVNVVRTIEPQNGISKSFYFPDDTTFIKLKKINVNLLDIRSDSLNNRTLIICHNKKNINEISLPTQDDIQGFSINWIKETENGFEISIEYGGSSRYYNKIFRFIFKNGNFELKYILINTFDKQNPEDEDSYFTKIDTLRSPVHVDDFKMENYL